MKRQVRAHMGIWEPLAWRNQSLKFFPLSLSLFLVLFPFFFSFFFLSHLLQQTHLDTLRHISKFQREAGHVSELDLRWRRKTTSPVLSTAFPTLKRKGEGGGGEGEENLPYLPINLLYYICSKWKKKNGFKLSVLVYDSY